MLTLVSFSLHIVKLIYNLQCTLYRCIIKLFTQNNYFWENYRKYSDFKREINFREI